MVHPLGFKNLSDTLRQKTEVKQSSFVTSQGGKDEAKDVGAGGESEKAQTWLGQWSLSP